MYRSFQASLFSSWKWLHFSEAEKLFCAFMCEKQQEISWAVVIKHMYMYTVSLNDPSAGSPTLRLLLPLNDTVQSASPHPLLTLETYYKKFAIVLYLSYTELLIDARC